MGDHLKVGSDLRFRDWQPGGRRPGEPIVRHARKLFANFGSALLSALQDPNGRMGAGDEADNDTDYPF
jgi:hypothetical protein